MTNQNDVLMDNFQTSIKNNINLKIKELKNKSNKENTSFSKRDLAADLGISPSALSHFLGKHGTRQVTLWEFYRICIILKTNPEVLAPITLAMTEDEKNNPAIRTSFELDIQHLNNVESRLILFYRQLSKDAKQCFLAMAMNFFKALGLRI